MAKASDNPFPSVLVVEGTAPAAPASGRQRLFIDSADNKLKRVNSAAAVTTVESAGAALGAWTSYTPTWAASGGTATLGNGTIVGRYKSLDSKTYAIQITLTWGSTTSATGSTWSFSLPTGTSAASVYQCLAAHILDAGTDNKLAVAVLDPGATVIGAIIPEGGNTVTGASPMTWASGDRLNITGLVEIA